MGIDKDMLLFLKSSGLGDGEPDLGEKLLTSFLNMLLESGTIPARIICMNSGIFLTTEGSQVIDTIKEFDKHGSEIFSCGTCLEYYGRTDKLLIGKPTNMKDTVDAMLGFKRIIAP